MVDSNKSCTEINLYDLSLLSTLQCTLQCMGHTQKCITGTQTFPCLWKTFLLIHKFGTAWAIEMTADREEWPELPMGATTEIRTWSGTSVIKRSSVPPRAWVGPITNWSQPDTVAKWVSWLQTVEMIRILKSNSGGKMQWAICWSGNSHLYWGKNPTVQVILLPHLWMCSSASFIPELY